MHASAAAAASALAIWLCSLICDVWFAGPQQNMNGPMGYGYPNQYGGGPMNGMGGNMRPAYGAPNGMPVCCCHILSGLHSCNAASIASHTPLVCFDAGLLAYRAVLLRHTVQQKATTVLVQLTWDANVTLHASLTGGPLKWAL